MDREGIEFFVVGPQESDHLQHLFVQFLDTFPCGQGLRHVFVPVVRVGEKTLRK